VPAADEAPLVAVVGGGESLARAAIRAWEIGEAIMPIDPRLPAAARQALIDQLRPTHVAGEDGERVALDGGAPAAAGVAAVIVTSGTTGTPKGVELTRPGLETMARGVSERLAVTAADHWLACLPLQRVAGLAIIARAWVAGVPWTALDVWHAATVAGAPQSFGATLVSFVPTMLRRQLLGRAPVDAWRVILIGGASCPPDLRLPNVVTTYGMTETWGGCALDGVPLDGVELRIADDGEVLVHSPAVMRGYRLAPDETRAVLDADGWFHTGDIGTLENGVLSVIDRKKDIVISGGVNVSPARVEAVLRAHPAIADVCVIGAPDPEYDERVVAVVVPRAPLGLNELRAFARDQLPADHLPRELRFAEQIPKTEDGKPQRHLLRELHP
jgi:O-succinylbenzoic acid--CoA ligase